MPIIKSNAFLLRKTPFRNSSYILDFLTEEQGRVTLIAKGAKREKSPFFTRLEYLEFLEILFIAKPAGMGILTECSVTNTFPGIRQDAGRLACGLLFFRLLRELYTETDDDPELFRICREFLKGFSKVKKTSIFHYYLYGLFRLIEHAGYSPDVEKCAECGSELESGAFLDQESHQPRCKACFGQKKGKKRLELSPNSINIIRLYKNRDLSGVLRLNSGNSVTEETEAFLLFFLSSVLNKNLTLMTIGTYNAV